MTSPAQIRAAHLNADLPLWDPEIDDRLLCVAVVEEIHDVRSFHFTGATPCRFAFAPGQSLTFHMPVAGETVNRCYTISSSPLRPHTLSITVKRVPNGLVSNWLHDNLKVGDSLHAVGPMGEFTFLDAAPAKFLFLSGGSGIKPLMSMSRALADIGHDADVVFLHAARTPKDIII